MIARQVGRPIFKPWVVYGLSISCAAALSVISARVRLTMSPVRIPSLTIQASNRRNCFRICRLGEEQPQSSFGVHDD
jgi:hypothetical protein